MDLEEHATPENFLFVTGRLAEPFLNRLLPELALTHDFRYSVAVMPINIAGLMSVSWLADRLKVPPGTTRVLIPGRCTGDVRELERAVGVPVERGPNDLHELPAYFRQRHRPLLPRDEYSLRVVAVIKEAANIPVGTLLDRADQMAIEGADAIGLWHEDRQHRPELARLVKKLKGHGHHVWVRTLDAETWQAVTEAGADFVEPLRQAPPSRSSATTFVLEPLLPGTWEGVDEALEKVQAAGRAVLLKQSLVPVGLGFTESLLCCLEARQRWPTIPLAIDLCALLFHSAADAAPMLMLLLGFAEEIGAQWILTTQDVNTARTSVRECHLIRRLTHCARHYHVSLRSLDWWSLAALRDHSLNDGDEQYWQELRAQIRDPSPRLFVAGDKLRAWAFGQDLQADDPYELFDAILNAAKSAGRDVDTDTAFYLGYELCKATIARQLGKNYCQDEALHWGLHTRPEPSPRERRLQRLARRRGKKGCGDEESSRKR